MYSVRQKKTLSTPNKTPSTPNKTQSTPTKMPSTPNKTPSAQIQSKEYAKQIITDLRCFVVMQFLSRIYALFGVPFTGQINMVAYRKWQIWGMPPAWKNIGLGLAYNLCSWWCSTSLVYQMLMKVNVQNHIQIGFEGGQKWEYSEMKNNILKNECVRDSLTLKRCGI